MKKREDKRYQAQVQTGYKADGKRAFKYIYAYSQRELDEKVTEFKAQLKKGIVVSDENLTMGEWAARWVTTYKADVEYNTRAQYDWVVEKIKAALGMYKLKELKPFHAQEMLNAIRAEGKARTAEVVHLALKQIVKQAVRNGFMYADITDGLDLGKKVKPQKRSLTDTEIAAVYDAVLPKREKAFVLLLLTTGLRKGEALALTRGDVDFMKRVIRVKKSVINKKGNVEIKATPKSTAGIREVPITDALYPSLKEHMSALHGVYLFTGKDGGLLSASGFTTMWRKIMKAMNIAAGGTDSKIWAIGQDITPHVFRHTFATLLYRADVDPKTAQNILGHATIAMTMDIYTHLDAGRKARQVDKFNEFMNGMNGASGNVCQDEKQAL